MGDLQVRPIRTLIAMTGSLSMIFLDATVVGVALPTIQADLGMTTAESAWVVNAFLVAFASTLAIGGRLGDRFGRLAVFRMAMILFAIGSLTCALASSGIALIIARAAQGIAAGTMQPASTAIVVGSTPAGRRGRAMATYFGVALLFLMAGPVVGGLIIELADWPWIFLLNLPVAGMALIMSINLGLHPSSAVRRRLDLVGIATLLTGLPALVLGLEWLGHPPTNAPWLPWLLGSLGVILTATCIIHSARHVSPLLEVKLIAPRVMLGQSVVLAFVSLIMSAQAVYGAIYLQEALAFTPLQAGLGSLPLLVPVILVIRSAGKMYDRLGSPRLVIVGLAVTLVGLCVEIGGILQQSYVILAIGMVLVGGGSTFASTPANTDVLSRAPDAQRGEVSGLVQTMRQLGSSIGIVICVLAIGWMVTAQTPDPLPDGKAGEDARRALEGDVTALQHLRIEDPPLAQTLVDARSEGMAAAFMVQGIACVAGLIVACVTLGRSEPERSQARPAHN
ncbi:MAG: MFS transporter [Phycisphaerales bacterium]|nr:MFS transporter [Phycisphaerales bacterium]